MFSFLSVAQMSTPQISGVPQPPVPAVGAGSGSDVVMDQSWPGSPQDVGTERGYRECYHGQAIETREPPFGGENLGPGNWDQCPCGCGHILELENNSSIPPMPSVPDAYLPGEERCPWWPALSSLDGEERCPWFIVPQPEAGRTVSGNGQNSQNPDEAGLDEMSLDAEDPVYVALVEVFGPQPWHGEEEDGLTPDLWERAAMEWERWHREWLSPPRSILGDEFWPHWMEPGGWVPVWFPTRYPPWLMPEEAVRWRNHWIYVRGYWMEAAALHPDDVVLRGTGMAWVSMEGWASRREEFHILVWDEELPILNFYGDWLD